MSPARSRTRSTKSVTLAALVLASAALVAGCGPADPGLVPDAAQRVFDMLRERKYGEIYDDASATLRKSHPRDEFVARLEALEGFGQLVETEPSADPLFVEEGQGRLATARYRARFTFAEGSFELTLRANDILGTWELEGYDYDVAGTTFDPPYKADAAGADQLARRFFHLWQTRHYGDLRRVMRIDEDPRKVRHFLENLENGGKLLTLAQENFEARRWGRTTRATARYALKFDKGKGWIVFQLLDDKGFWRVDSADYQIEYNVE